ncbi:MAG: aromatic amino acid ammonia-lyase [bacterium]|nr:aromatic amino acid ammonia-lyase [bacterium]
MGKETIQNSRKSIRIELDKVNIETILKLIFTYYNSYQIPSVKILISSSLKQKINEIRSSIENIDKPIYGINTGFGKLFDKIISMEDLEKLQSNLIYSHSAGYGKQVSKFIVFLTILIRLKQLSIGYSGVSLELLEHLCDLLKEMDLPDIPCWTSVGASGDLIPLSHIFLRVLERYNPKIKESIAFINGTSYSLSNFIVGLFLVDQLIKFSNFTLILSSIANNVNFSHFSSKLKRTKNSKYFSKVIDDLNELMEKLIPQGETKSALQASYSYRCYPQILESFYGIYDLCVNFADSEIKSNTDNPLLIDGDFISAGNFHGNTISVLCDHLKVHIFQLSNLSFQRMNYLLSPNFLILDEGLNSGFMISQYLASHILVELKNTCYPISIENFPVSLHQEDLVSYSENNSRNLMKSVYFSFIILSIELLLSIQKIKLNKKMMNFEELESHLLNFFNIGIKELIMDLPILNDDNFKKYGSLSGLQKIFISNNKVISFFEQELNL